MSILYEPVWECDEFNIADDPIRIANAIAVWSWQQNRPTSVAEAALAFNMLPGDVVLVIDKLDSPYFYVPRPVNVTQYDKALLEHDGE